MEKMEQYKQDSKTLEDYNKFIHDKLIALTTAIIGFTILVLGDDKFTQINKCILKISWIAFGVYLIFSISVFWSFLRHNAILLARNVLISIDESELQFEGDSKKKHEKTYLINTLRNREFVLHNFLTKITKERQIDPVFEATKSLFEKYKTELNVIKYSNIKNFESISFKDKLMVYCIYKGEWSYVFFGIGMITLIVSAL